MIATSSDDLRSCARRLIDSSHGATAKALPVRALVPSSRLFEFEHFIDQEAQAMTELEARVRKLLLARREGLSASRSSVSPMRPPSGVRSSCDMLARKALRARVRSSARSVRC